MKFEIKQQWVKALRSGEYSQGHYQLRNKNNQFCCLGVLCDLYLKEKGGQWLDFKDNFNSWDYAIHSPSQGEESETITPEVAKWAGLEECNPKIKDEDLSEWNDFHDLSFNEIADLIESNL